MAAVAVPISTSVAISARLRPNRSPRWPNTKPPSGRARKPTANVAKDASNPTVNDPYMGGTHLMDVKFVKPFFYKGRLFAWPAKYRTLAGHRRHGPGRILRGGRPHRPGGQARRACFLRNQPNGQVPGDGLDLIVRT